jgi:drug/metabolite transporter (DMT)-like permease
MSDKNQNKAYLFALLAMLFWSTISSATKITLRYIAFDQLLLWSAFCGALVLLIINQLGKKPLRAADLNRKAFASSALMGFFNPFLYYLILFKAYELLEAQIAGTLNYAWPIALVLLSIPFLKQKISFLSILAIVVSFIGIVIISTRGHIAELKVSDPLGVSLAVGSAFIWAMYWILNMKDQREETGKITLNLIFGFIYMIVYMVLTDAKIQTPKVEAIIGVLYIGIFEMSITFVVWLRALNLSKDTAKVSNLIYLSPFLALFIIKLTVGEKILPSTILGLAFIVTGIIMQQVLGKRKAKM